MLKVFLYLASSLCFLFGVFVAVANWVCLYTRIYTDKNAPSTIPLLGGIFMFIGFYFFPSNPVTGWAWLALLLDYGCIPMLVHFCLVMLIHEIFSKKQM